MENHTKRIRKARRQGLATKKDLGRSPRVSMTAAGMSGRDVPGTPRAGVRRKTLQTGRKARRQARSTTRRATARR